MAEMKIPTSYTSTILRIAGVLNDNNTESVVNAQAEILWKIPGISKPDNWDELPVEEKLNKINRIIDITG